MKTLARTFVGLSLLVSFSIVAGCDDRASYVKIAPDQPYYEPAHAASDLVSRPGGAPSFGASSGMGFTTGTAAQSGGMGTGLMGFHGTGSAGTSGAISDVLPINRVVPVTTEYNH